jgi:hypothetical protein
MKRALYYLLLLTIIGTVYGCKKDKIPVSNSLAGTWELSMDVNGMTGYVTHHKPGNDTLMTFTADGSYSFYNHKTLTRSGKYTVRQDTSYLYNALKTRIIFDYEDSGFTRQFFDINNNQLSLFLDAYDAGGVVYRRIK